MAVSYTLVVFQFIFLGLLFCPYERVLFEGAWILASFLFHLALFLLFWTAGHNRFGNYNIIPEIKTGSRLIQTGPYSYMRHPMYSAVILIGSAVALYWFHPYKIAVLFALVLTLFAKAKKEERLWCETKEEYAAYKKRTGMFFPRLFKR